MYAVFQPRNMSGTRLMNETYAAYKKFYSLRRTILDSLSLLFNVSMDALVWNFENINRYNLDYLFIRAGAKTIVTKGYDMHDSYLKYMHELERKC